MYGEIQRHRPCVHCTAPCQGDCTIFNSFNRMSIRELERVSVHHVLNRNFPTIIRRNFHHARRLCGRRCCGLVVTSSVCHSGRPSVPSCASQGAAWHLTARSLKSESKATNGHSVLCSKRSEATALRGERRNDPERSHSIRRISLESQQQIEKTERVQRASLISTVLSGNFGYFR